MNHGHRWIVPANLLTIAVFELVWATSLPLWSTCLIALPIGLLLAFIGIDAYGGMQIVSIAAPTCLFATICIAGEYRHSAETNSELNIGLLILRFAFTVAGTIVGFAVVFLALALVFEGVAICLKWSTKKNRHSAIRNYRQTKRPPKSPVRRKFDS